MGERLAQAGDSREGTTGRIDVAEQRCELQDDDDAADTGHESGDHRIGHKRDVAAELVHTEADLEGARHDDHAR